MGRRRASRSTASDPAGAPVPAAEAARTLACRYLARAPRSAAEVARLLDRRGVPAPLARDTLQALRDLGYVDDGALARRRAEELLLRRGYGRLRVAAELIRRGLTDSVIDAAIQDVLEGRSEHDLARAAFARALRGAPGAAACARAFRRLAGRGHPIDVIRDIVEEQQHDEGWND